MLADHVYRYRESEDKIRPAVKAMPMFVATASVSVSVAEFPILKQGDLPSYDISLSFTGNLEVQCKKTIT